MQACLYIDEDAMDDDLVQALRLRGADVQTALEAGLVGRPDEEHLAHAAGEERVLYTFNVGDFMRLHGQYMSEGREHAGIIFGDQQRFGLGEQMRRLLKTPSAVPKSCVAATSSSALGSKHRLYNSCWGRTNGGAARQEQS